MSRTQPRGSQRKIWILRIANCLVFSAILPLLAAPLPRPYTVDSYDARIRVDLVKQRVNGEVTIGFHTGGDTSISALELDAGGLQIASVLEGQAPQWFERRGAMLVVVLTKPLQPDEHRAILLQYQAKPAPGLKFYPDQVYTTATSDWMPCNDRPGERATLRLAITAPPDAKVAASGQLNSTSASAGQSVSEWQLDSPTMPSLFGFALGTFTENTSSAEGVKLRVLGAGTQIFEPTAAAMRFLGERSGKHYPGPSYTQVFAHGVVKHSMAAGLTLLPESYAQELIKQPDALELLTDQLAQQWFGVQIVAKDWADLWLSQGVSAFLAESYMGQKFGKERFERDVEQSRQIYNQFRAQDKDRPLSFSEWTTSQEAHSEILADKGACFLYLVDQLVGDSAFWEALRSYTADHWDQTATSEDLQKAFEAVSGRNPGSDKNNSGNSRKKAPAARKNTPKALDNLFDVWVYGIPNIAAKKKG